MKFIIYFVAVFGAIIGSSSFPLKSLTSILTRKTSAGVTPQVSDFESRNPFLRLNRDVGCPIPQHLPKLVKDLNTFLPDSSSFIGLCQQPAISTIPANQPELDSCPTATGSWWPGKPDNLKSTCPWVYIELILGDSFYPRSILEANCVCSKCIGSNVTFSCRKLRTQITVFQQEACQYGLAMMKAVKIHVTTGCYCVGNSFSAPVSPTE